MFLQAAALHGGGRDIDDPQSAAGARAADHWRFSI
jgi:hypothetical protein